jgi:hypothetical protein
MKKFLTIVLAIVMVAMMFVMVGCGKTVGNNNEDGSTNNDGNSVINTDKNNNNNKTEEIVDKVYIPDTENLVGIAVYPVKDGDYPYVEGQKITDFSDWKFFYIDGEVGTSETTRVVFDGNIIDRDVVQRTNRISISGCYETNERTYWGYIYNVEGDLYLIATEHIACDKDNGNSESTSSLEVVGAYFNFYCNQIRYNVEPTHYQYVFQIDDVKDENGWYVGRTVYSSEIYTIDTLPTEITFDNEPWVNFVAINLIANDEVLYTQKVAYYSETPYVGDPGTTVMLDLYKDGESYQHVITVNKEK